VAVGHEDSSGEIKVRLVNSNLLVRNQEAVVLALVKISLSYMGSEPRLAPSVAKATVRRLGEAVAPGEGSAGRATT
jgi:hypothetical protein